jgi:hypothetical protein
MEGGNVRGARPQLQLPGKQLPNTFLHLIGGFVRERHSQYVLGWNLPGFDQISNPVGDNAGLAAAGSCQDKEGPVGLFYGGALLGIELVEKVGHSEVESRESKVES